MIAGLIALSMIAYGIVTSAWTMSVAVAMVSGLFFLIRNEKHKVHRIRILPIGIELDGVLHAWNKWKNFWILVGPHYGELHVATTGWYADLLIQTGPVDPFEIRDVLLNYLPQNPNQKERLLDTLIRFCKL